VRASDEFEGEVIDDEGMDEDQKFQLLLEDE
jgi:hypothetical protein